MSLNPYECSHSKTEIRKRLDSMKRPVLLPQCLICGGLAGPAVKRSAVLHLDAIPVWDEAMEEKGKIAARRVYETRREELDQERLRVKAEMREKYAAYLLTPEWKNRRRRVLERDGYTCKACGVERATQVHHKTYDHIFNEPLWDLESVCDACHRNLHPDKEAELQEMEEVIR